MEKNINQNQVNMTVEKSCNLRIYDHPSPVAPPRRFKVINKIIVNSIFVDCQGCESEYDENTDITTAKDGHLGHPKVRLRLTAFNNGEKRHNVLCPYCGAQFLFSENI